MMFLFGMIFGIMVAFVGASFVWFYLWSKGK